LLSIFKKDPNQEKLFKNKKNINPKTTKNSKEKFKKSTENKIIINTILNLLITN
jgi:hypothetical protein